VSSVKDLLNGGGATSFPFVTPGDTLTGTVVSVAVVNQTHMDGPNKGKPVYWDDNPDKPKLAVAATVQTTPPLLSVTTVDPQTKEATTLTSEDGRWGVFFSGNKFTQLRAATDDLNEGDTITVTFREFSNRAPAERGHSRAKLFDVGVVAKPVGVKVSDIGTPAATPPSAGTAPAATPAASTPGDVKFGVRPDNIPEAAWASLPAATKAQLSPYVEPVASGIAYGAKPDYLPSQQWDALPDATKATLSPPGFVRPDFIPQAAWDAMDSATQATVAATASPV
jgi:hypothetical protein